MGKKCDAQQYVYAHCQSRLMQLFVDNFHCNALYLNSTITGGRLHRLIGFIRFFNPAHSE